jgi:hypothetical protein
MEYNLQKSWEDYTYASQCYPNLSSNYRLR